MVDNLIISSKCDEIIDEVQEKWVYLSLCVKQKPLFWLRHMCPSITNGILSDVDNIIRLKFNNIIGQELTDDDYIHALLPLKKGGVGIGTALELRIASYVANVEEINNNVLKVLPSASYLESDFLDSVDDDTIFTSEIIKNYTINFKNLIICNFHII